MIWETLISRAVVGTARNPLTPDLIPPGLDPNDQEGALLALAAGAAQQQKLLKPPQVTPQFGDPSPEDERQPYEKGLLTIQLLLQDEKFPQRDPYQYGSGTNGTMILNLIRMWLEQMEKEGKRVPEQMLPGMLEAGTNLPIREALLPVLGERGQWLAGMNPEWVYAAPHNLLTDDDFIEKAWTWPLKFDLFWALRRYDPAKAVEVLESRWNAEKSDAKAKFIGLMKTQLSPADYSFLEHAFAGKSVEVQRAVLLLMLPKPEFPVAKELAAYLAEKVRFVKGGFLKGDRLEIDDINEKDPFLKKYGQAILGMGIAHKDTPPAAHLAQCVPPSAWSNVLNMSPHEVLSAVRKLNIYKELVHGWSFGTIFYEERDWADALLEPVADGVIQLLPGVARLASVDKLEAVIRQVLKNPREFFIDFRAGPDELPAWDESLTREILKQAIAFSTGGRTLAIEMLKEGIFKIPVTFDRQAIELLPQEWTEVKNYWERVSHYRRTIRHTEEHP